MKYFLTGITFFFFVSNAAAQQAQIIEQYCMVKVFWNAFAGEASIAVDDGSKADVINLFTQRLRDSSNRIIKFKSRVDALNYMGNQGWKMMHVVSNATDNTDYVYLFKKEVRREE